MSKLVYSLVVVAFVLALATAAVHVAAQFAALIWSYT